MASRRKNRKEDSLDKIILADNFLVRYTLEEKGLGVFFAIGRRNARAVRRNKIKRIFRETLRRNLKSKELNTLSLCLISKKHSKFTDVDGDIVDELKNLAVKLARVIDKKNT